MAAGLGDALRTLCWCRRTRRGAIVLPDAADGAGPLYWAVLGVG